jgi:hypothetical protein
MLESDRSPTALRSIMVICLALLAGCLPHTLRVAPAPANLVATSGASSIALTWNASLGATTYNVKRAATSGGPYTQLASTAAPSYTDSSVANGPLYYYVVSAVAPDGESQNSAEVSATLAQPPPAPSNVRAIAGDSQVTLSWGASNGAAGYRVKRSTTAGGPYTPVATPVASPYVDVTLTNGITYFYVISAVNVAGESPNSTQVSAVPDTQNPPPTTFGTWTSVTPSGVDLSSTLCSNFGTTSVQADPAHPGTLYTQFHCQGIWKSTDYGVSWAGPINTGTNGAAAADCSGGIAIAPGSTASVPTIYQSCIRGSAIGFWKSVDGGVSWTQYPITPTVRQDYYPPAIDPYDGSHLVMVGHEFDSLVESFNGGVNWTSVPINPGMVQTALSPAVFFINTGNATATRGTWLWMGDQKGGVTGTWRTVNGGAQWVKVDSNEHIGNAQVYQPNNNGIIFMAGASSALGNGVLRSTNYGQTWTHVGLDNNQSVVFGSAKNVYSMYGFPVGPGGVVNPAFQVASQPGSGTWVAPGTPLTLTQGPAQVAVVNNGSNSILVGAMWNAGLWRYVEP